MSSRHWIMIAVVLGFATIAGAQQPPLSAAPTSAVLTGAVSRIRAPERLRVSYLTNWAEGTFVRSNRDSIVMQIGSTAQPLAFAVIDTLFVHRRSTVRGTIAGAVLGSGLGVLIGLAYEHKKGKFGTGCDCGGFPRRSLLIGAVGGAGLGAALGFRHYHWHRVYSRKAPWE